MLKVASSFRSRAPSFRRITAIPETNLRTNNPYFHDVSASTGASPREYKMVARTRQSAEEGKGRQKKDAAKATPKRQSMRTRAKEVETAEEDSGPRSGIDSISEGEGRTRLRRKAKASRAKESGGYLDNPESIKRTMKELNEMDEQLHRACKRQRQKIESSDIMDQSKDVVKEAFKPKDSKHGKEVLIHTDGEGDPSIDDTEKAPMEREGARRAAKDLDAAQVEVDGEVEEAQDAGAARPPPVNSGYLPLPWQGRLGYACLNTYLRTANPPVFCSRTCRIASILEHRHPLQDPAQPEHATKNRPNKSKPANVERGQKYVQELGLANARDIVKMIRWNDQYGIKFLRLSSEMFPFASHEEHGYKLAPFASEVLVEAGRVAGELGHRLTVHPGQFTQLGSPRSEVITASIRDLEYHDEMLTLLKLPSQQDRDAVMILHMGGTYGDKPATLDRFRANYAKLSPSIKRRLVLENDDVSWSVHDLLSICEELNIPLVLDFHHHNIIFESASGMREGTADIMELFDRIAATWTKKGITQKMHYSEPCAGSVTPRERRKHSARVKALPPCAPTMDLMIEAKDKEQAVFELMRTYKLPGWEKMNDVVPYEREDEGRVAKGKKNSVRVESAVSADDFAMGGPMNRVYWPEGMEEWLKPKKREKKIAEE